MTMLASRLADRALRVAVVSLHTSPLDQPGTGDAGGMNVYIARTAERMATAGAEVDVFTRATSDRQPDVVHPWPGVRVHHLSAGPLQGVPKEDLPGQVCAFTSELLRRQSNGAWPPYDVVHSHYWLSGQAAWLAAERWDVPMVHTMHTMAKVKNAALTERDKPEPRMRVLAEEQLAGVADRFIANTADEAADLVNHYGADPGSISVVHPGVDVSVFRPGDRAADRRRLGIPDDQFLILFVGRIQPLKAPDLLLRAVARVVEAMPELRRRLGVVVCGGPSGGTGYMDGLSGLVARSGIEDLVRFQPPTDAATLAKWYGAADLVVVPSFSESFGLVALESQACGTPVLAAGVGGLRTAVRDGEGGFLIDGHGESDWADILTSVIVDRSRLDAMSGPAVAYASQFSWAATAAATLAQYRDAIARHADPGLVVAN
ncbi:MAG: D-inositol-3-phosphate glycosyltransferase [Candidatus Nanopelagicales bacterium]|nr:D-inositol-3-phosphate glycosyltransferase [Candidatus Nanopelagicales bacterium]MDZ4249016.1 D-inositol-3-phosphate glycosyltransferase [Candidatus Nanopelagicales bacterium]